MPPPPVPPLPDTDFHQHTMAASPAENVFALPELLEMILLQTYRDEPAELKVATQLFGLLRVNRTFHDTITRSPVLREQMTTPLRMAHLWTNGDGLVREVVGKYVQYFGRRIKTAIMKVSTMPSDQSWNKIKMNPSAGRCMFLKSATMTKWVSFETTRETTWDGALQWKIETLRAEWELESE